MKTVRFAGSDVFNPKYPQLMSEIQALCAAGNVKPQFGGSDTKKASQAQADL